MSVREVSAGPTLVEELDHSIGLARIAAIVESSDDASLINTRDSRIHSWNVGAAPIPHRVVSHSELIPGSRTRSATFNMVHAKGVPYDGSLATRRLL
jgi:hypothetical protein